MKSVTLTLTGTRPLLTANGSSANPLDPYKQQYDRLLARKPNPRTKEVRANPGLMHEWMLEEERLLAEAAHYYDEEVGIHVPANNLLHMLYESFFGYGGTTRKGAERLSGVVQCTEPKVPLSHERPYTPQERVDAGAYRVGMVTNRALGGGKVRAVQAMFLEWSLTLTLCWPDIAEEEGFLGKNMRLNAETIIESLRRQGQVLGLAAYRKSPAFGNFDLEVQ